MTVYFKCLPGVLLSAAALAGCTTTPSPRSPTPVIEQGQPVSADQTALKVSAPGYLTASNSASATQPPAVVALLQQAEQQANAGDLESAAASLERAIRIDPRNPVIWHHLATVRLSQGEPRQAEQLATKSNSLAPGNHAQQSRNWLLIAEARRQLNNRPGAAEAEAHARKLGAR